MPVSQVCLNTELRQGRTRRPRSTTPEGCFRAESLRRGAAPLCVQAEAPWAWAAQLVYAVVPAPVWGGGGMSGGVQNSIRGSNISLHLICFSIDGKRRVFLIASFFYLDFLLDDGMCRISAHFPSIEDHCLSIGGKCVFSEGEVLNSSLQSFRKPCRIDPMH